MRMRNRTLRLRKRFRQIVTDRIAATVQDPIEVQDELSYRLSAMTSDATMSAIAAGSST